jgi:hypothetical protein
MDLLESFGENFDEHFMIKETPADKKIHDLVNKRRSAGWNRFTENKRLIELITAAHC